MGLFDGLVAKKKSGYNMGKSERIEIIENNRSSLDVEIKANGKKMRNSILEATRKKVK